MARTDTLTNTGPLGELAAEREPAEFAETIRITDCTLRDGEQQAGVAFTAEEKLRIAQALDELGVYEIEAGTPAVSDEDATAVKQMVASGLQAKLSVLTRARTDDIDAAADLGVWGVRISLPISKIQRETKVRLTDDEYLDLALRLSEHAKSRGLYVVFSPYDTTRADMEFLRRFLSTMAEAGTVDRVRIVDTSGCATPEGIRFLVHLMKAVADIPLEIHCHDDLGLAVANTLAGALAGAEYLSVTVNGLGERCGNAALEEVAVALRVLYGIDVGLDLTRLRQLSGLVQSLSRVRLHDHKSVVGSGAFSHESGMVVAGVLQNPFTAECYAPELVGHARRIVLGKLSGLTSVRVKLSELGLMASDDQMREILELVKSEAIREKTVVNDDRFVELAERVMQAN